MEEWGKGLLQARFEALKEKLREEGLFDEDRKQPLPLLPQHVGVVTSPTGAAIRDILNVVGRRFPNLHIVLAPVKVQGGEAAEEIARAVDLLNERGGLDVLIVGRGGGSLEDLWCFNEETVARAIARSRIPVVAAVGHEIDFTIADFVADLRAPTPSAAAELVVGKKEVFEEDLRNSARRLTRALRDAVRGTRDRLLLVSRHHVFRQPEHLVRQYRQGMDGLDLRMRHELRRQRDGARRRLGDLGLRAVHEIRIRAQAGRQQITRLDSQMAALNPLAVLKRGYSVTHDMTGAVLRRSAELRDGQRVRTRLAEGTFESEVVRKTGG
jgi:exodeoxyribonuclease VII large subunit